MMAFQPSDIKILQPEGVGYYRSFEYDDPGLDNNLPPDLGIDRRSIFIIGDKNSGKTAFSVMGLNSDKYKNSEEYAKALGMSHGEFVNIEYSGKKLQDHKGPYLDTDFGEGRYIFDFDIFSKKIGVGNKGSYDVLELDVVEFGGDLLRRMRKYDRGEKFREEANPTPSSKERINILKNNCSVTIKKLESFSPADTVFYFVNLHDLYEDDRVEMGKRFDKLVDRINFIKGKNPLLKIKYVLNRVDDMGGGYLSDSIENFVHEIGGDSNFKIKKKFERPNKKYDKIIHDALAGSFKKALSKQGLKISKDDVLVAHVLDSADKVHAEDGFKLYEQIYSVSKQRKDISDLIIKSSLSFLAQNGEVSALQVEQTIRGRYRNSKIGAQFSKKVISEFESAMSKLSDKGVVIRKCAENKSPRFKTISSTAGPITTLFFVYCEKGISPVQPPAYRISELDSIKDFVQLLNNNKIPVKVLENEKNINLPQPLINQIRKDEKTAYAAAKKTFNEAVNRMEKGDKGAVKTLVDNIRDPYRELVSFMEYSTKDEPEENSRPAKEDPAKTFDTVRKICGESSELEPLAVIPGTPVAGIEKLYMIRELGFLSEKGPKEMAEAVIDKTRKRIKTMYDVTWISDNIPSFSWNPISKKELDTLLKLGVALRKEYKEYLEDKGGS